MTTTNIAKSGAELRDRPRSYGGKLVRVRTIENVAVYLEEDDSFVAWIHGRDRPGTRSANIKTIRNKIRAQLRAAAVGQTLSGIRVIWYGSENFERRVKWQSGVIVDRATDPRYPQKPKWGREARFRVKVRFVGMKEDKWVPEHELKLGTMKDATRLNKLQDNFRKHQRELGKAEGEFPTLSGCTPARLIEATKNRAKI